MVPKARMPYGILCQLTLEKSVNMGTCNYKEQLNINRFHKGQCLKICGAK